LLSQELTEDEGKHIVIESSSDKSYNNESVSADQREILENVSPLNVKILAKSNEEANSVH